MRQPTKRVLDPKTTTVMKTIIFTLLSLFLLASCSFVGAQTTADRDVATFTKIGLSISADVYLTQGDKQSIRIEAKENVIKLIETEVNNETLKIKFNKNRVSNTGTIKIYITVANIDGIAVSGSGDVYGKGLINTTDMGLAVSGSGAVHFENLHATSVTSRISGSGDVSIDIGSTTGAFKVRVSGSGGVSAADFEANTADVVISGSGSVKINAKSKINGVVSGSGDIYYKGDAQVDMKVSGSGSIKKI